MGTGSFLGVKTGRDVTLTPHPLLVPWSRKSRAKPLLPLWAVRPVQSLGASTRVYYNFNFTPAEELDGCLSVLRRKCGEPSAQLNRVRKARPALNHSVSLRLPSQIVVSACISTRNPSVSFISAASAVCTVCKNAAYPRNLIHPRASKLDHQVRGRDISQGICTVMADGVGFSHTGW